MGKFKVLTGQPVETPNGVLPPGFDLPTIAEFFSDSRGVSEDVRATLESLLGTDTKPFGVKVSETAKSGTPQVVEQEDDGVTYEVDVTGLMTTTQDDILQHDHDHADDEHDDTYALDLDGLANARGGKKLKDGTEPGGGKAYGKNKPVEEEPAQEEPVAEEIVVQEPEPAPEETVVEEVIVEQPVEEEPVLQDPAPLPSSDFGWLDNSTYLSGGDTPNGFNLLLEFNGDGWTTSQKEATAAQAELLSDYIIGDLPDNGAIDDIVIDYYLWDDDGAGGVWGRGGHTSVGSDGVADSGVVYIDSPDIGTAEDRGMIDELMMHETLHAMGWGTNWGSQGLLDGKTFIGENAMLVYGGPVAIDGSGHLAESVGNEMGTTYIGNGQEDFSDLTLAVLEDMGFDTVFNADVYGYA